MKTISIPQNIGAEGFQIPIVVAFTGFKFLPPVIAFSKNGASPSFILHQNHLSYKVFRRKSAKYSDIEKIDIGPRAKNLILDFKESVFRVTFHISQREDLIEVLHFFQKKSVQLSDRARELSSQH